MSNTLSSNAHIDESLRAKVYWWLERPDRNASGPKLLEINLITLIILNVSAVIIETVDSIYQSWKFAFDFFETASLCIFICEFLLRLWIAAENPWITKAARRKHNLHSKKQLSV